MELHYGSGGLHCRNILERRKEVSFKATNSLRLSLHLLGHNLCWYNMYGSRVFTKKVHFALSNTHCMASRQNKFVPKAKVSFMHPAGKERRDYPIFILSSSPPPSPFLSTITYSNEHYSLFWPSNTSPSLLFLPPPPPLMPFSSFLLSTITYSHEHNSLPPPPAFSSFLLT